MGSETKIQWTDHTFNPWRGCAKVSPGCAHCYAEKQSRRNPAVLGEWGPEGRRAIAAESYWRGPEKWDAEAAREGRRRRVFCASLADWLELREDLESPRLRLLDLIRRTPNLDWLLLSKRPENLHEAVGRSMQSVPASDDSYDETLCWASEWIAGMAAPENVWLGVSVEDQRRSARLARLAGLTARIRFCSAEPLLGPLDLATWIRAMREMQRPLHWVIVGGESGSLDKARPCDVDWIRSILNQCQSSGVACFVKQLGSHPVFPERTGNARADALAAKHGIRLIERHGGLRDPKGGDMAEWPQDLRVREFPALAQGGQS